MEHMKKIFHHKFFILLLIVVLSNCGIKQVQLNNEDFLKKYSDYSCVSSITFDEYFRPVFNKNIKRPKKIGDMFHIVYSDNNKPIKSFNILVDDINRIIKSKTHFHISYVSPTNQSKIGARSSGMYFPGSINANGKADLVILAIYATVIIIAIVPKNIGKVIIRGPKNFKTIPKDLYNLPKGIYNKYLLKGQEILLGNTDYAYDNKGRIIKMTLTVPYGNISKTPIYTYNKKGNVSSIKFVPEDKPIEIFQIVYFYQKNSQNPYKVNIIENLKKEKFKEVLFYK